MFEKKIEFIGINKDWVDIHPHPKASKYFIPESYKKFSSFANTESLNSSVGDLHVPTIKKCMPFLDSMTAGYIIPFDQDYIIDPTETDFSISPASLDSNDFGFHKVSQLPGEWKETVGDNAGKFHNKWLIKTPPGYSCLFVHPMNRLENRWKMIEGIVDTHEYMNLINFPFYLKKRDEQFLIEKGTPMMQVIPFKREPWKSKSGFRLVKESKKTFALFRTSFHNVYRKYWWKKKSFK